MAKNSFVAELTRCLPFSWELPNILTIGGGGYQEKLTKFSKRRP